MKETKLEIPADCEVDKIETQDGHIVVTFREKERKPPKTWEDFCEMFPCSEKEYFISSLSEIVPRIEDESCSNKRHNEVDMCTLPDRATAEAVLALCQLIQLRNAYNGGWVPDWTKNYKYVIEIAKDGFISGYRQNTPTILYFKTEELRDEFLRNFRPLIEKLKPLYGIKEGGEE